MRNAFLPLLLIPALLAGPGALADEAPTARFSGALSYDGLTLPESTASSELGPSQGDFTIDLYRQNVGPLSLSLGTGLLRGEGVEDHGGYMLGLRLDYGDLAVASQWRGIEDGGCGLAAVSCDEGPAWNFGATYSAGAASLSAQFQSANPLGVEGIDSGNDVYRLGLDYQFFDGFSSRADAYFIDGEDGGAGGDSTVFLIGTRINF